MLRPGVATLNNKALSWFRIKFCVAVRGELLNFLVWWFGAWEGSVSPSVRTSAFFQICIKIGVGSLHTAHCTEQLSLRFCLLLLRTLKVGHGQIEPLHEAQILFPSKRLTV
jgi:hypothetical protein